MTLLALLGDGDEELCDTLAASQMVPRSQMPGSKWFLGPKWPCLFCICHLQTVYPAHRGNFWIRRPPGPWLGKSAWKIKDLVRLDLAWEGRLGIRMDPIPSVWIRINPGTPSGCIRTRPIRRDSEMLGFCRIFSGNVRKALWGFRQIWIPSDEACGGWGLARTHPYRSVSSIRVHTDPSRAIWVHI